MSLKTALVAGASLLVSTQISSGQAFNQFIAFGDSSIDSGFYKILPSPQGSAAVNALWPSAVAHGAGKPTSSPGLMSSGGAGVLFRTDRNTIRPTRGHEFCDQRRQDVTINTAATGGFGAAIPTVTQIASYLAGNGGRANPNGLYLISSGGNDVTFAIGSTGTGPFPSDAAAYLVSAATSLAGAVASLHAAGAQYFVVPGQPYAFPTGAGNATERGLKLLYSQTLWSSLAGSGVNFVPADINAARLAIASNPSSFGFQFIGTGAGQFACTRPAGVTSAWALLCSSDPSAPSHLVDPTADQTRLFADDQHLTTAGQKIVADYEHSLVVAPSEMSFLAEVPVKTRAGVISAIDNQIPLSLSQPGQYHAWVSGDTSWIKMSNSNQGFPDDPGTPVSATAGFDFRVTPNWLIGAAFSGGTTRQSFSLGGGFRLDEYAISAYAAYVNGSFWGNAVAGAGQLFFDTNRQVPIGITVDPNTSNAKGGNLSLALETGYNFISPIGTARSAMPLKAAPAALVVTHGPVVGIVLQQIRRRRFH